MCGKCVDTYVGSTDWPAMTDEMTYAARLVAAWYSLPDNGTGGALHVQLDDFNLDDDLLAPEHFVPYLDEHPEYEKAARFVAARLLALPIGERAVAVISAPIPSFGVDALIQIDEQADRAAMLDEFDREMADFQGRLDRGEIRDGEIREEWHRGER